MSGKEEKYLTKIWYEEAVTDDPFSANACFCAGYNVYDGLLGKISWPEYLFLLFQLEKPSLSQAKLLEGVAIAIATPGMRDHSVLAAMNAGVGGSTSAACLMAALGVGAGQLNGSREVYLCVQNWVDCGTDLILWEQKLSDLPEPEITDIWEPIEHAPGFNPNSDRVSMVVIQTLEYLSGITVSEHLTWLKDKRENIESYSGYPLSMSGVISAAFHDLGFSPDQSEMLYLLLRLPGAAVHALEQRAYGWRRFPFYAEGLKLLPYDIPAGSDESPSSEDVA